VENWVEAWAKARRLMPEAGGTVATQAASTAAERPFVITVVPNVSGPPEAPRTSAAPTPYDILMPGGQPIGTQGSSPDIRELPGGPAASQDLFARLSRGGKPASRQKYDGPQYDLPGGGWVGRRTSRKSGDNPIDVNIPKVPFKRIHVPLDK
jgi:hypothetical protein